MMQHNIGCDDCQWFLRPWPAQRVFRRMMAITKPEGVAALSFLGTGGRAVYLLFADPDGAWLPWAISGAVSATLLVVLVLYRILWAIQAIQGWVDLIGVNAASKSGR